MKSKHFARFYFETDNDCRTGCFSDKPVQDLEVEDADAYEAELIARNIDYIRIDI